MLRVTLNDLSRLPVDRLAGLLLEWAAEDRTLLSRLHATIQEVSDAAVGFGHIHDRALRSQMSTQTSDGVSMAGSIARSVLSIMQRPCHVRWRPCCRTQPAEGEAHRID